MPDRRTDIGARDDLRIESSRCKRMRFSESDCSRCIDICPHGAVTLEGGLAIDPERCRGCLLCTAVCPVGALEHNSDFAACMTQLSRVPEPVLGCIRTKESANASLACLGGLSEEHLLALIHTLAGSLTLNLSVCGDCPNSHGISEIKSRLEAVSAAGLDCGACRINLAESVREIRYRDESVDRRSFFKSFGSALIKSAAVVLSRPSEQTEQRSEYACKRVPARRELLNKTRSELSLELTGLIREHFDSCASFDQSCTACQGCTAICPTGALKTGESDIPPTFDQLLCTGCGLCREFCLDGAIRVLKNASNLQPSCRTAQAANSG